MTSHSSVATPTKESLKPCRKPHRRWRSGVGARQPTLSASKCEVAFFINNSKEALWEPSIQLDAPPLNTISLQLKTTSLGIPGMVAGVTSIAQQAVMAYVKAHRLLTNHHRRALLEEPSRHRLKRPGWRSAAKALTSTQLLDANSLRDTLQLLKECPWALKEQ